MPVFFSLDSVKLLLWSYWHYLVFWGFQPWKKWLKASKAILVSIPRVWNPVLKGLSHLIMQSLIYWTIFFSLMLGATKSFEICVKNANRKCGSFNIFFEHLKVVNKKEAPAYQNSFRMFCIQVKFCKGQILEIISKSSVIKLVLLTTASIYNLE